MLDGVPACCRHDALLAIVRAACAAAGPLPLPHRSHPGIPHHATAAVEDMQVSTSPYGARAAAAAPAAAAATVAPAGRELAARPAAAAGEVEEGSTWVTVFGFSPSDLPLVIREFSKAGHIQQVGAGRCGVCRALPAGV